MKVRLPARSVLTCTAAGPGLFAVEERLAGDGGAKVALGFAAFVLGVVLLVPFGCSGAWTDMAAVTSIESAALVTVGLLVVHNTWRKTLLRAADGELSLALSAPLAPTRRYDWPAGFVDGFDLVATGHNPRLAELRIRTNAGPEAHLFTDHPTAELREIAASLAQVLANPSSPPAAS